MNDLVSVIIPTYNRSHFLVEAIESVLSQTYPNVELIVVNDGSTDDTETKLAPYMDKIEYIKKVNGGISSAVNTGLQASKGKYITRLDDDDLFLPEKIAKQVEVFENNPDIGLVTSGCFVIDSIGRITSVKNAPDFSDYGTFLSLLFDYAIFQSTVMVLHKCHDKLGFYRKGIGEDYDMFVRIARYWEIGVVNEPLAKIRRHDGNITRNLFKNEVLLQDVVNFARDILDDVTLDELFPSLGSTQDPYRRLCAYAAKGALYLRNLIPEKAEFCFHKALEILPQNQIPILWLGILSRDYNKFQAAEEYFNKIKETDDLYPMARIAKDLMIAIQRGGSNSSPLLFREKKSEFTKFFRITYEGISGKVAGEASSPKLTDEILKLSRYTIIVDNYPKNGKHVVFNLFTQAMVTVDDDLREFIREPNRSTKQINPEYVEMMRKMGNLVNREFDETKLAKKWYDIYKKDMSTIQATILTNYDCNYLCSYCIEEGVKKPVYMSDRCSEAVADWLENRAKANNTKQINLSFYGGEPLLNTNPIINISIRMRNFAEHNGVIFSSSIFTNGSLLDKELLQKLANYGLKSIKVTIDGVREIHDVRRPYKNGKGTFDVIIKNIQEIPDTIELNVLSNLDEHNIDYFPDLLNFFENSGLKDRINSITVGPIAQQINPSLASRTHLKDYIELNNSEIAVKLLQMKRLIIENGFKSKYDKVGYAICNMNRLGSSVVIDPLGLIWTCPAFVGREKFSVGDIYHPELKFDAESINTYLEKCIHCEYFFICGGGCRYSSFKQYGDCNKLFCERRFIEEQAIAMIKLASDTKAMQKTVVT